MAVPVSFFSSLTLVNLLNPEFHGFVVVNAGSYSKPCVKPCSLLLGKKEVTE